MASFVSTNQESIITTNPIYDRNIAQTGEYININKTNIYLYMDEAYYGSGGFRDGRYLIPFSRESSYEQRRQLAHYKNYLKPIIRAMIDPCFTDKVIRKVNPEDSLFSDFIDDCDASGMVLQDYSYQALNICRRHGLVLTVVDNFPEQPETYLEAKNRRIYPYIYHKKAYEVDSYILDSYYNLSEIILTDKTIQVDGKPVRQWRRWTRDTSTLLQKSKDLKSWIEISVDWHNLGIVPVILTYSEILENKCDILPDPPLYDLARLNAVIYNQSAEIRDQERAQAFSIFYCQGMPTGDVSIGPTNYINIPLEASITPGYASPDFSIIAGLVANQEQIRKDLYSIAEQNGVVGVQNSESGIAKSYDFFAHESTLKKTSSIATTLEDNIAEIFKLYTGEKFEYNVIYPTDFQPMGLDREIDRIEKILKLPGLDPLFKSSIQKKLVRLYMSDEPEETVSEIIDSINSKVPKNIIAEQNGAETDAN